MFQLKSWQGIYGRIQADIDASHRGHSSTPLTRGGLAHCWLISLCMPCKINVLEEDGKVKIVGMKPTMISQFFSEVDKKEAEQVEKDVIEMVDNAR